MRRRDRMAVAAASLALAAGPVLAQGYPARRVEAGIAACRKIVDSAKLRLD